MKLKNMWVIIVSVIAMLLFTGIIIYLACFSQGSEKLQKSASQPEVNQLEVASDAQAGENNSEIKSEIAPEEISGKYIDDNDGWYHEFVYAPAGEYDGTFTAGFDPAHPSTAENAQTQSQFAGYWKLDSGEIKLFSDLGYLYSIFACGEYLVDAQNYFVGEIPEKDEPFMSAFICKAGESGDTQILSFYPDGKFILEIIRNDGTNDTTAETGTVPSNQLDAGTYEKTDGKITATINGSSQEYYIVEDGLAKWIYHKV